MSGEPLKYRPDAMGGFLLYSVGWDEKDDNGAPLDAAGKGDWGGQIMKRALAIPAILA